QRLDLRVGRDRDEVMLDLARVLGKCVPFYAGRAVRVRARERADLAVERGREQHRLAILGQALKRRGGGPGGGPSPLPRLARVACAGRGRPPYTAATVRPLVCASGSI